MSAQVKNWAVSSAAVLAAGALVVTSPQLPTAPSVPVPAAIAGSANIALAAELTPIGAVTSIVQGLAGSGQRLTVGLAGSPRQMIRVGQAVVALDPDGVAFELNQFVTAPLWIADPTIRGFNDALPAPIGQGTGDWNTAPTDSWILAFRTSVLWPMSSSATRVVDGAVALTAGLLQSGVRTASGALTTPLAIIPITQGLLARDNQAVFNALVPLIHGPLWIVDPALRGLNDALPAPIGQGTGEWNTGPTDSFISAFRTNTLWPATLAVRNGIADLLGADGSLAVSSASPTSVESAPTNSLIALGQPGSRSTVSSADDTASRSVTPQNAGTSTGGSSEQTPITPQTLPDETPAAPVSGSDRPQGSAGAALSDGLDRVIDGLGGSSGGEKSAPEADSSSATGTTTSGATDETDSGTTGDSSATDDTAESGN